MLGFGWCLWSCSSIESHPPVPEIHFKKLVIKDSLYKDMGVNKIAVLTFSFLDGDGDIGVSPQDVDSVSKIHYTWYKKLPDMTYEPYQFGKTTSQASDIPWNSVMDKTEAQNKLLKGVIKVELFTPTELDGVDTMRIEYYILDRARSKSNIDHTPDFSMQNPPAELFP
jgi:hypothetical protein